MPRTIDEQQAAYLAGVERGLTGAALARAAGIRTPEGSSPPMITPPVVAPAGPTRWRSAVNDVPLEHQVIQPPFLQELQAGLQGAPYKDSQKAVAAAMQLQGITGYQRDLASGMPMQEALAKWAPTLPNLTGTAAMLRATAEKPKYSFVAGSENEPARFEAPGMRPVVVPRSALPQASRQPLEITELMPGVQLIRDTQSGTFKIATGEKPLTEAQRGKMLADVVRLRNDISMMDPEAPNTLEAIKIADTLYRTATEGSKVGEPIKQPATLSTPPAPSGGAGKVSRLRWDSGTRKFTPVTQ